MGKRMRNPWVLVNQLQKYSLARIHLEKNDSPKRE
jgi:hypothetical protein